MARRVTLALPRLPALRPLAVPPLRRPRVAVSPRRILVTTVGVAAFLAIAYTAARETPLFALREVRIAGAPPALEAEVRSELQPLVGTSLVKLDPAATEARVRAIPSVRFAQVDRGFPHTLTVVVRPERALAVIRDGRNAWLLAESGRVIGTLEPAARPRLPRVRTDLPRPLEVGSLVRSSDVRAALAVLRALPRRFPVAVLYAEVADATAVLALRGGAELRLRADAPLATQLRAAAAVLRSLEPDDLTAGVYIDVSVPAHVVVGTNSQPESEG